VLRIVAAGKSNRETARMLWVTDDTVKFHLANIYRRLGIHSREEAAGWARRQGLLETGREPRLALAHPRHAA
jgi:DNA-binding CsgD family transcriptional regulator